MTTAVAPKLLRAILIVHDGLGPTGYPLSADQIDNLGIDKAAEAFAGVVRRRPDAGLVELRLELDDRTTVWGWHPAEATAEHFAGALREPTARMTPKTDLLVRRYVHGRWTVGWGKEVGPPRWRGPHIGVWPSRRRVKVLVGWNFTAWHCWLSWHRKG